MTDRTEIPGIAGRSARRRPLLQVAATGLVAALLAALAVVGPLGLATASSAQAAEPQPPVGAGQTVRITTGTGKSTTVWGNLTITGAREIGYAEAFPCGKPRATAVNVSIDPGRSVADFAVVGTDEQGAFCVFVSVAAHVVFDQVGTSDLVRAGPPQRVFDTGWRSSGPPWCAAVGLSPSSPAARQLRLLGHAGHSRRPSGLGRRLSLRRCATEFVERELRRRSGSVGLRRREDRCQRPILCVLLGIRPRGVRSGGQQPGAAGGTPAATTRHAPGVRRCGAGDEREGAHRRGDGAGNAHADRCRWLRLGGGLPV